MGWGRYNPDNVLCIGDLHLPFVHKDYLDFCREMKERLHAGTIMFMGDIVDLHAVSQYAADPNGKSASDEVKSAKKMLLKWYKYFPKAYLCLGNHDRRPDRKGKTVGIPSLFFKPFNEVWAVPKEWNVAFHHVINNTYYTHGQGYNGKTPHIDAANDHRMSTVIGHVHTRCGVDYLANWNKNIFGMCVGCGIDVDQYAFEYERENRLKPIDGLGVTTDRGRYAQAFAMGQYV